MSRRRCPIHSSCINKSAGDEIEREVSDCFLRCILCLYKSEGAGKSGPLELALLTRE
jgi:hypothetical protein